MIPRRLAIILITLSSIPIILIISLFFIRLFSEVQIDDISPGISCSMDLLKKSDNLLVIPEFNGKRIADNKTWCNFILSLNKTLSLHGLTHEYKEFNTDRNQEYLQKAIEIFYDCFGFYPEEFKPPQLAISNNNKNLVRSNMRLLGEFNQIIHKVYHCSDTATPNWIVNLF